MKDKIAGFVVFNLTGVFEFGKIRIPKNFNEQYGVCIPRKIVLVMDNGDSWSSIYDQKYHRIVGLEKFMEFYGVKTYWFVAVYYFGGMNFGINIFSPKCVEILYPKFLPTHPDIQGNESVDVEALSNHAIVEEKNGALLFFNVGYSGSSCNFFSFVVQFTHLRMDIGKVVVCEDMYHVLKKFKNGEKITLRLLKTKWEILIEWQEEYDFVMFNSDLYGANFFHLVFPDSLERYTMVLPISFGYCLGKSLSSFVEFVMPSDRTWSISYEDNPARFSLLNEFVSFYGLVENFILIFEYLGHSSFFVRIFEGNGLEISYLKLSKSLVADNSLKSKYPRNFGKGFVEDYIELCDEIYGSLRLLSPLDERNIVCRFTLALDFSKTGKEINDVYVCNSVETFFGDWINGGVSRLIAHGRQ
ncbi:hypothetical protein POM88_036235 [Heracleum sosnowskyi]|uniref:TF-B3 domain-containing protein n=1 Tax=Heracleum sosnowskyi TaxID=360622 RepID=A0AAD8MFF2_9APIA|nr:hypothetical protein POM88_036235 [Heracleum sosnowskyi]